jgi:nucleoside phosphorylase
MIYKPARLFATAKQRSFSPVITNTPALPAIAWADVGQTAPTLLTAPSTALPTADVVVFSWAEAEWAPLEHVFVSGSTSMPYADRSKSTWSGWHKYAKNLPSGADSSWTFWGDWRLVQVGTMRVLLFKSNTHLDFPGATYLADLVKLLIADVKPSLILSLGTAGGASPEDHVGTIRAVSAGTLYAAGTASSTWPVYTSPWKANDAILDLAAFAPLAFPVPTTPADLTSLVTQFNAHYGGSNTLAELDPDGLNLADPAPRIIDQTGGAVSLLTTPTFVVGTTDGTYASYACIEMDDAIIGQVAQAAGVSFGFVRNISDPVQNAALSSSIQGSWGSAIYDAYGFYTSYNGALAAWAMLAAAS